MAFEEPAFLGLLITEIKPSMLRVVMRVPLLSDIVRKDKIRGAKVLILINAKVIAEHKGRVLNRSKQRMP